MHGLCSSGQSTVRSGVQGLVPGCYAHQLSADYSLPGVLIHILQSSLPNICFKSKMSNGIVPPNRDMPFGKAVCCIQQSTKHALTTAQGDVTGRGIRLLHFGV